MSENQVDEKFSKNRDNSDFIESKSEYHTSKNKKFLSKEDHGQNQSNLTTSEKLSNHKSTVAENMGGVSDAECIQHTYPLKALMSKNQEIILETTDSPEVIVRDLEYHNLSRLGKKKFSKQERNILLLAASLHLINWKGITVGDLIQHGYNRDNAEKMLSNGKKSGILIPSDKRIGKQIQYFLSNYKYVVDKRLKNPDETTCEDANNDVISILLKELTDQQYIFHRIELSTSLNHLEDYIEFNWPVNSTKNKQKVAAFNLTTRRNCTFTLSTTGTLEMSMVSTVHPFRLSTYEGLIDFFTCCGKIEFIVEQQSNYKFNVIPKVSEWHIKEFDYNKDLMTTTITEKYPQITWTTSRIMKLKYLGQLFQIYGKSMPDVGECLRVEGNFKTKKNIKAKDVTATLINSNHEKSPFVTAEELLHQWNNKKTI